MAREKRDSTETAAGYAVTGAVLGVLGAFITCALFAKDHQAGYLALAATLTAAGGSFLVGVIAKGVEIGTRAGRPDEQEDS